MAWRLGGLVVPRTPKSAEVPAAKLSGFAQAISTLVNFGVPAKRIAELFDTNANHIYQLAHRGRASRSVEQLQARTSKGALGIEEDSSHEARSLLHVRAEQDGVELTPRKKIALDWLEATMNDIAGAGRDSYRYLPAVQALRQLKSHIGYPSESNRLKLAAKLHQHIAWFLGHSGFTQSSIREAIYSSRLYKIVYKDTDDLDALRELGGSCLIGSNSNLIQAAPKRALQFLEQSRQATEAAGLPLNSEYFQQCGVALFQERQDTGAREMFQQAMATIPDDDVKDAEMTLKMAGDRHINLISGPYPKIEDELVLLEESKSVYGPSSLETSVCLHWAAACALSTDSTKLHHLALELITQNQVHLTRFGHQATIAKLLPLTLELPKDKRAVWIRMALYQNAYKQK